MDIDSQENHNDPQFVKVLETCLKMEIDTLKKSLDDNIKEIKEHKRIIHNEINKRKQLKEKVTQMNKVKLILSETLTKLYTSISESSDTLELVKANADDQYKLMQIRSQEYQDIVDEYKKTWQEYRATYEEFPLAKVRKEAQIKLQKLKVEYMIVAYKKKETLTIIKQRREISWICTRNKIIEFATVMLEHMKLQKELANVNEDLNYHRKELQSIEKELQALRKKEEDQKRQRKQKMLEMPPPKINIPYREMYAQNQMRAKVQHQWKQVHESLDGENSFYTLQLLDRTRTFTHGHAYAYYIL
ncbi:CAP-Gly domain-containing linker protein 1-like [Pogonomyrmex barbatus]|uniref:CAP-Gly domain-containing linker protein 1-like n=1 Tax=Pogonomyrmex barbatus TaxID=144034 RepID=A0A6I9VNJ7_9HYME|nr:CAP-Gly domain-containing linker protein 1-like [Pogonomyrmex barbatus]